MKSRDRLHASAWSFQGMSSLLHVEACMADYEPLPVHYLTLKDQRTPYYGLGIGLVLQKGLDPPCYKIPLIRAFKYRIL
jgi:hypothetical protein